MAIIQIAIPDRVGMAMAHLAKTRTYRQCGYSAEDCMDYSNECRKSSTGRLANWIGSSIEQEAFRKCRLEAPIFKIVRCYFARR